MSEISEALTHYDSLLEQVGRLEKTVEDLKRDRNRLDFLLAEQPRNPLDNRGYTAKPMIMQSMWSSDDGAFSGYRTLRSREDIDHARRSHE